MHTFIERELDVRLVVSPERSVPVPTRLRYDAADPYAVHVTFHDGSEAPVRWTFARDLLIEGLFRPSGHGDVRVWPARAVDQGNAVFLALSSPEGEALIEVHAPALSAWLERTLRLVAPGAEAEQLSMEDELHALQATAPGDDRYPRSSGTADEPGEPAA